MAPIAVQEAAVPPARAAAALVGLEYDDVERRVALHQRERGPEARVATADNRDVGLSVALERRGRLRAEPGGERFLQPPNVA